MAKGSVYIDGVDIDKFGMFILRGGDYDLLSFPERVTPKSNNWHEYDGLDVDLDEAFFREKKVSIDFYISADNGDDYLYNLNHFYQLLGTSGYRQVYSRVFEREFSLRYVDCPEMNHKGGLVKDGRKSGKLKVEFSMDDPLQLFPDATLLEPRLFGTLLATEQAELLLTELGFALELFPSSQLGRRTHIKLDGYDLAQYGIIITECYNSVLPLAKMKKPLIRRLPRHNGLLVHPSQEPTFESKEITVRCAMLNDSLDEFYHNYQALFNRMRKSGAINFESVAESGECYYKQMQNFVKKGTFKNRVYVTFDLIFVLIDSGITRYILSTENQEMIMSENGYLIGL